MTDAPANDNAIATAHDGDQPRATMTAASDLEALARAIAPLFGSAFRMVHTRGGVRDDGPSDKTLSLLPCARRALARLTGLRASALTATHARVLLAHYVYAGEARRADRWLDTLRLALVPAADRRAMIEAQRNARSGPFARAALAAGQRLLAEAELAYLRAPELTTDGRWVLVELDAISRALIDVARAQIAARSAPRRRSTLDHTAHPSTDDCADDSNRDFAVEGESLHNLDTEHLTLSGQRDTTMTSAQLRPAAVSRGEVPANPAVDAASSAASRDRSSANSRANSRAPSRAAHKETRR